MYLRFLIALLAAAAALPQAAAEDCAWPESGDPEPASAVSRDGLNIVAPEGLPIEVTSGGAEVTRQGDATLSDGVVVRQGSRRLSARSASYDAANRRFEVEGDVEFRAPDLRLKGSSGCEQCDEEAEIHAGCDSRNSVWPSSL